jgi:NADH dehydrogenase
MERVATVFGGSGFIGRYIVKRLAQEGWVVRVAVRDPASAYSLKPLGNVGQIVPFPVRVQDPESVASAVSGADAVFNLVGILYEPGGEQTFEKVQQQGAGTIAEQAAEAGVPRMIHVSAIGADEASDSVYARTKALGENAVLAAMPSATILRPSIVVGPEDDFFNRFAAMARISPVLPLIGGGKTRFQPVYVGDVADAAMAAVHNPDTKGQTYELGGPRIYTFKQLMELMLKEIGRRRLLLPIPFDVANLQARVAELLPKPPLTRDQLKMLKRDNVVSAEAKGFADLGIKPQAIEVILPRYLHRYRIGGRFAKRAGVA